MTGSLLRIDSSIKPATSASFQLSDEIIAKLNPNAIVRRDVTTTVAPIDADWIGAVFTPAEDRTTEQNKIADISDALIQEIKDADALVIGMGVYNFSISTGLKNWIDQIARARVTFRFTDDGPEGLLEDKPVYIAYASDGTLSGSEIDFAERYLRHMLGFIGLKSITTIAAERIAADSEAARAKARKAISQI